MPRSKKMGFVYTNIKVGNQDGGEMMHLDTVLVDTGSAHTVLPAWGCCRHST